MDETAPELILADIQLLRCSLLEAPAQPVPPPNSLADHTCCLNLLAPAMGLSHSCGYHASRHAASKAMPALIHRLLSSVTAPPAMMLQWLLFSEANLLSRDQGIT